MQRAWQALRDQGFVILAVDVGESPELVKTFAINSNLTFPLLIDQYSSTVGSWAVRGFPSSWLLDKQGRQVFSAFGDREWDSPYLLDVIRRMLAEAV